jgi:hypothetical protein
VPSKLRNVFITIPATLKGNTLQYTYLIEYQSPPNFELYLRITYDEIKIEIEQIIYKLT